MKNLLCTLVVTLCALTTTFSQNMKGIYANTWAASEQESISYTLALNEDGTFAFQSYQVYIGSPDKIVKVMGRWESNGVLLSLITVPSTDPDNPLIVGLNNSKARLISLSPRHPDFNLVKPTLEFAKSDVFYVQGMELKKQESTVSVSN